MNVFFYDKTFAGLLTVVFDAYKIKLRPHCLLEIGAIPPLLMQESFTSVTDREKARRVWRALIKRTSFKVQWQLAYAWLCESEGADLDLFRYICKIIDTPYSISDNLADDDVRQIVNRAKKVAKEYHAMAQFSRFQKSSGDLFFAPVAPRYDVLPLVIKHFCQRLNDQKWIVYDELRHYGYYYDLKQVQEIELNDENTFIDNRLNPQLLAQDEKQFQQLWQQYYQAMKIKERLNLKQQRRCMPRRFWCYLTEMNH